jgi:hypothetical protein
MWTVGVPLLTLIAGAVVAGVGGYFTGRRELQLKFDESLRTLRIDAYKQLWAHLGELAKYGRPKPLRAMEVHELTATLRKWYFETGGLFLSTEARVDYFALQDGLGLVAASQSGNKRISGIERISEGDDEYLRVLGSRLRTAMTRDVGTRRTFVFRGDPEREEARLEAGTYVARGESHELVISSRRTIQLPDLRVLASRLRAAMTRDVGTRRTLKASEAGTYVERGGSRKPVISSRSTIELPDGPSVETASWDPGRRTLSFIAGTEDAVPEERVLLLEDGGKIIVEGPVGWMRSERRVRRPSVIWERRKPRDDELA